MNEAQKKVHEVMEELSYAHHIGKVKGIIAVTINSDGEPELRISFGEGHLYALNTALDVIKRSMIDKLIDKGSKDIKDDDT